MKASPRKPAGVGRKGTPKDPTEVLKYYQDKMSLEAPALVTGTAKEKAASEAQREETARRVAIYEARYRDGVSPLLSPRSSPRNSSASADRQPGTNYEAQLKAVVADLSFRWRGDQRGREGGQQDPDLEGGGAQAHTLPSPSPALPVWEPSSKANSGSFPNAKTPNRGLSPVESLFRSAVEGDISVDSASTTFVAMDTLCCKWAPFFVAACEAVFLNPTTKLKEERSSPLYTPSITVERGIRTWGHEDAATFTYNTLATNYLSSQLNNAVPQQSVRSKSAALASDWAAGSTVYGGTSYGANGTRSSDAAKVEDPLEVEGRGTVVGGTVLNSPFVRKWYREVTSRMQKAGLLPADVQEGFEDGGAPLGPLAKMPLDPFSAFFMCQDLLGAQRHLVPQLQSSRPQHRAEMAASTAPPALPSNEGPAPYSTPTSNSDVGGAGCDQTRHQSGPSDVHVPKWLKHIDRNSMDIFQWFVQGIDDRLDDMATGAASTSEAKPLAHSSSRYHLFRTFELCCELCNFTLCKVVPENVYRGDALRYFHIAQFVERVVAEHLGPRGSRAPSSPASTPTNHSMELEVASPSVSGGGTAKTFFATLAVVDRFLSRARSRAANEPSLAEKKQEVIETRQRSRLRLERALGALGRKRLQTLVNHLLIMPAIDGGQAPNGLASTQRAITSAFDGTVYSRESISPPADGAPPNTSHFPSYFNVAKFISGDMGLVDRGQEGGLVAAVANEISSVLYAAESGSPERGNSPSMGTGSIVKPASSAVAALEAVAIRVQRTKQPHLSSVIQTLQAAADRNGVWLSLSTPRQRHPPLHACGHLLQQQCLSAQALVMQSQVASLQASENGRGRSNPIPQGTSLHDRRQVQKQLLSLSAANPPPTSAPPSTVPPAVFHLTSSQCTPLGTPRGGKQPSSPKPPSSAGGEPVGVSGQQQQGSTRSEAFDSEDFHTPRDTILPILAMLEVMSAAGADHGSGGDTLNPTQRRLYERVGAAEAVLLQEISFHYSCFARSLLDPAAPRTSGAASAHSKPPAALFHQRRLVLAGAPRVIVDAVIGFLCSAALPESATTAEVEERRSRRIRRVLTELVDAEREQAKRKELSLEVSRRNEGESAPSISPFKMVGGEVGGGGAPVLMDESSNFFSCMVPAADVLPFQQMGGESVSQRQHNETPLSNEGGPHVSQMLLSSGSTMPPHPPRRPRRTVGINDRVFAASQQLMSKDPELRDVVTREGLVAADGAATESLSIPLVNVHQLSSEALLVATRTKDQQDRKEKRVRRETLALFYEVIGRLKGELLFLFTGVDNRREVLQSTLVTLKEDYMRREQIAKEGTTLSAMIAAQETYVGLGTSMTASTVGGGKSSTITASVASGTTQGRRRMGHTPPTSRPASRSQPLQPHAQHTSTAFPQTDPQQSDVIHPPIEGPALTPTSPPKTQQALTGAPKMVEGTARRRPPPPSHSQRRPTKVFVWAPSAEKLSSRKRTVPLGTIAENEPTGLRMLPSSIAMGPTDTEVRPSSSSSDSTPSEPSTRAVSPFAFAPSRPRVSSVSGFIHNTCNSQLPARRSISVRHQPSAQAKSQPVETDLLAPPSTVAPPLRQRTLLKRQHRWEAKKKREEEEMAANYRSRILVPEMAIPASVERFLQESRGGDQPSRREDNWQFGSVEGGDLPVVPEAALLSVTPSLGVSGGEREGFGFQLGSTGHRAGSLFVTPAALRRERKDFDAIAATMDHTLRTGAKGGSKGRHQKKLSRRRAEAQIRGRASSSSSSESDGDVLGRFANDGGLRHAMSSHSKEEAKWNRLLGLGDVDRVIPMGDGGLDEEQRANGLRPHHGKLPLVTTKVDRLALDAARSRVDRERLFTANEVSEAWAKERRAKESDAHIVSPKPSSMDATSGQRVSATSYPSHPIDTFAHKQYSNYSTRVRPGLEGYDPKTPFKALHPPAPQSVLVGLPLSTTPTESAVLHVPDPMSEGTFTRTTSTPLELSVRRPSVAEARARQRAHQLDLERERDMLLTRWTDFDADPSEYFRQQQKHHRALIATSKDAFKATVKRETRSYWKLHRQQMPRTTNATSAASVLPPSVGLSGASMSEAGELKVLTIAQQRKLLSWTSSSSSSEAADGEGRESEGGSERESPVRALDDEENTLMVLGSYQYDPSRRRYMFPVPPAGASTVASLPGSGLPKRGRTATKPRMHAHFATQPTQPQDLDAGGALVKYASVTESVVGLDAAKTVERYRLQVERALPRGLLGGATASVGRRGGETLPGGHPPPAEDPVSGAKWFERHPPTRTLTQRQQETFGDGYTVRGYLAPSVGNAGKMAVGDVFSDGASGRLGEGGGHTGVANNLLQRGTFNVNQPSPLTSVWLSRAGLPPSVTATTPRRPAPNSASNRGGSSPTTRPSTSATTSNNRLIQWTF